jgi:plasmid stability protein
VSALTIRGLDEATSERLKHEAALRGTSVNTLVKHLLRVGLGLDRRSPRRRHGDLDALAGTWSEQEAEEFARAVEPFERVDPELWR